jgi:hypothetical protein
LFSKLFESPFDIFDIGNAEKTMFFQSRMIFGIAPFPSINDDISGAIFFLYAIDGR